MLRKKEKYDKISIVYNALDVHKAKIKKYKLITMEEKTFLSPMIKTVLIFTIIILTGILLLVVGNPFKKAIAPISTPLPKINAIEISADGKSIVAEKLYTEVKIPIFTIADAQKYLKDSGYAYNPDTFQDTNSKYAGDCFLAAVLSNNKDRIVFSTGCLPGDLPQAWIGVYKLPYKGYDNNLIVLPEIKFLIGGSGRNFVWSADDKTITYEADLGESGLTEIRTIDSTTGEIIKK